MIIIGCDSGWKVGCAGLMDAADEKVKDMINKRMYIFRKMRLYYTRLTKWEHPGIIRVLMWVQGSGDDQCDWFLPEMHENVPKRCFLASRILSKCID